MVLAILRADKKMNHQVATNRSASGKQNLGSGARTLVRFTGQLSPSASNQECSCSGSPTPTGLRLFPLFRRQVAATLSGLYSSWAFPQGSSFLATLGFEAESLWDS